MARSKYDAVEYAIKFYVSRAAFEAESGLYSQRAAAQVTGLSQFLPRVCNTRRAATEDIESSVYFLPFAILQVVTCYECCVTFMSLGHQQQVPKRHEIVAFTTALRLNCHLVLR